MRYNIYLVNQKSNVFAMYYVAHVRNSNHWKKGKKIARFTPPPSSNPQAQMEKEVLVKLQCSLLLNRLLVAENTKYDGIMALQKNIISGDAT